MIIFVGILHVYGHLFYRVCYNLDHFKAHFDLQQKKKKKEKERNIVSGNLKSMWILPGLGAVK